MSRLIICLMIFLFGIAWTTLSGYYLKDAWDKWRVRKSADQTTIPNKSIPTISSNYKKNESIKYLVEEIELQAGILNDHLDKSIENHNYYKEIANKVFLLTGKSSDGLLLKLMTYFNYDPEFKLSGPGNRTTTLSKYLSTICAAQRTPTGLREFTPLDLVSIVALEDGGVQKTSSVDEGYAAARDSGFMVGGDKVMAQQLKAIARTVVWSAREFVQWIRSRPDLVSQSIRLE